MSKKRKTGPEKPEVEKQSEYYELKTRAVDDLVGANEDNSPEVSEEELRAYRSGPKLKLADWVKILLAKAWFAGAVCFFFIWGLGGLLGSELDILFVTGLALGVATDLLVNPILRFFEKTKGENERWMMVSRKGLSSLFLNVGYGYVLLALVYGLYNAVNLIANRAAGTRDMVFLGVEPILFGLFCLGFDLLLIQLKHMLAELLPRGGRKTAK